MAVGADISENVDKNASLDEMLYTRNTAVASESEPDGGKRWSLINKEAPEEAPLPQSVDMSGSTHA